MTATVFSASPEAKKAVAVIDTANSFSKADIIRLMEKDYRRIMRRFHEDGHMDEEVRVAMVYTRLTRGGASGFSFRGEKIVTEFIRDAH